MILVIIQGAFRVQSVGFWHNWPLGDESCASLNAGKSHMLNAAKKIAINHLEPRFYGALWFAGAATIVAMITLTACDRGAYKEEITLLAAMLAITVATIGWIWSGRMAIMMTRKTNALAALERLGRSEVNDLKDVVYPYIEAYDKFKRDEDCQTPRPKLPELEVQKLLGIYEQLAVAVYFGAVDTEIIRNSQALVFKRIYRGLFHHIEKTQEKDKDYFINFEKLTCKWHPDLERKAAAFSPPGGLFAPMRGSDI